MPTPSPLNTTLPPNTPPPNTSTPPPPSTSQHPMVTRFKVGIMKDNPKYNFHITTSSLIPKSHFHALRDPNWKQAMCDEYKALIDNETWVLVPCPPNVNIVRSSYAIQAASSTWLLQHIISSLHAEFAMTDLGPVNYFLGISVTRTTSDTKKKLGPEGSPATDPTLYCSLAGALQYLTFTRLDLSYAVQQLCLYMHDPREPHLNDMKHVLRCPATRRSTSGYCVFLGDNLLTWSSKRQDTLSRSSAEAEYRGVANAVTETSWIRNLLRELHTLLFTATLVYCDNVSAVYMSANPVQHQPTKHIEVDIHFVRDKVVAGHVRVLHFPSRFQYVDIFTKGLPYPLFTDFRSSLSVRKSPASTAGAY
ncbi:ribonuclease H-like domain-containing protein [Tanacetum coccineum]